MLSIKQILCTYYPHISDPENDPDTMKLVNIIITHEEVNANAPEIKEEKAQAPEIKEEFQEGTSADKLDVLRSRQLSGDQRSAEWLRKRVDYITASVSAACAGLMGASARQAQLIEKATYGDYRTFTGGYHTDMGNIFEDLTASHYEKLNKTRVNNFQLIPHLNEDLHLGASTDGITDELINIEIKTLAGRELDDKIKKAYYHQTQHQMECLGLDVTHFLEATYQTFSCLMDAKKKSGKYPYGIILEFYNDSKYTYLYSPQGKDNELIKWEQTESIKGLYVRTIYWCMTGYSQKVIKKDPQWIIDMEPAFIKFWDDLVELRADPVKLDQLIKDKEDKTNKRKGVMSMNLCMI